VFVTVAAPHADPPNSIAEPFLIKVALSPDPTTAVIVAVPASNEQEVGTLACATSGAARTVTSARAPAATIHRFRIRGIPPAGWVVRQGVE
jgi:hypothetical protein